MSDRPIVHVIKPTVQSGSAADKTTAVKRRVAAYARVSTAEDEQLGSYENQITFYTQYIKNNLSWEFAGIYSDEGITGLNTRNRAGFNQMVQDALAGKIDLILTKSISRFARNTVDTLVTIRSLKEKGVEVYFEKENIYTFDSKGELLLAIMSSLAQEESRSISENVIWGKRNKMRRGEFSLPYRHFLGYEKGANGKPQIVKEQAAIVRRIYDLYLEGNSARNIARILTDEGVLTPYGKNCKWSASTVIGILRNEKYKGEALLQKTYTEDFLNKKRSKNNGVLDQYHVEHSHPAIIDPETFALVQEEMARRSGRNSGRRSDSPFDRKIICGACGRFFGRRLWQSDSKGQTYVWNCPNRYDKRNACKTPIVRENLLQQAFIAAFNKLIGGNKAGYLDELEAEIIEVISHNSEDATEKYARIGKIRRYLEALGEQPEPIDKFSGKAFLALVENVTVPPNANTLVVRFKDGTEITIPRTNK